MGDDDVAEDEVEEDDAEDDDVLGGSCPLLRFMQ